jgi:hypothetical protein
MTGSRYSMQRFQWNESLLASQDVTCSVHWGRKSSNKKRYIVKKAGLERANLKYLIKVYNTFIVFTERDIATKVHVEANSVKGYSTGYI